MSFPSSPYRTPKRGSPASRHRSPLAYLCPLPCARRPESQRAPRTRRVEIELFQERRRNILDYLDLPCGQVLPPASRLRLAPLLTLAVLFLWYVLPGVFLHRARKLGFLHRHIQRRVDALHRLQSICPQVLVSHEDLEPPVGIVGLLGVADVPHVPPGLTPHEGIWSALGQRRRFLLAAFPHQVGGPGPILVGVEVGGDD